MKILNLYAGIGGNRRLWGNNHQITAVEYDEKRANTYKNLFPNDKVLVEDAHKYLLENYKDFDFIWSSPPCPTHSITNHFLNAQGVIRFPDMKLYQEIIFLKHFYKGKYCVENVKSYYEPLIKPQHIGRHYLWANFIIPKIKQPKDDIGRMNGNRQKASKKTIEERNAVNSELGLHILNRALNIVKENNVEQNKLF
jgi:DNA (cytosine-5)-methyltransferase 1